MSYAAGTTLEPYSALGMTGIPNSGPYFLNDASIILPVGNQIIQQSLDTGERYFFMTSRVRGSGSRHCKTTAFSVSQDGQAMAIASLRNDAPPVLCVFAIPGGQEIMELPQENSMEVHFVEFHSKLRVGLMLVTDPRRFRMTFFNLDSKTEGKSVRFNDKFEKASFHPVNDSQVLLFSSKTLAYYNKNEKDVVNIPVPNYSKFTGFVYCLNDPTICVASSGRDLLLFRNMKLEHVMTITEESPIVFLATFIHGLILATDNYKVMFVQWVSGFKEAARCFQQGTVLSYDINHPIVWASFSPSGHQMLCNVDYRQLLIINTREFESDTENSMVNPNILSHKGPVAAISSCGYKHMLASCGVEDGTVIIWDYVKQASVLHSEFDEDLIDVSFHPSGDLLAVASSERLYLLAVTVDALVDRAQWPLFNCLSIEFSNGGHFLVAASHIITFINPYTHEIIATLRGHTGLIRSVSWSPDDKRLVSSGSDGSVVEWNAVTQQEAWSTTIPKCNFEASAISDRGTVIVCSRSEIIHHLFASKLQKHISEEMIGYCSVCFVTPNCLVFGDVLGGVVVVPFPFLIPPKYQAQYENIPQLEFSDNQEYSQISNVEIPFLPSDTFISHCGPVTSVCASLDGKVLFTAAADSCICIFNVLSASQSYVSSNIPILRCDIPKEQFFLVSQSKFDELQHAIEKVKKDIQKQKVAYETTTVEALEAHERTMNSLTGEQAEAQSGLNHQIESIKKEMDDFTVKAALIYQNMEAAHLAEAKSLTKLYEQKLALETSKCEEIRKELEDLKCSYEERIYILRQQYKSSLDAFSKRVDQEQVQLNEHLESTKDRINKSEETQNRQLIDLEMEFEKDRMQINLDYHNKILALEKLHQELLAKKAKLELDTQQQENELDEMKSDLDRVKERKTDLDKEIKSLQHTFNCRTSELNDRDETIMRQAERLDRLQSSNSELQKNKDIMTYRLQQMGQDLQPSLDEISRLQSELDGNSEEIRAIKRNQTINHRTMHDKAHQIEVLERKLEAQKTSLQKKLRLIQMFTFDLRSGFGAGTDPAAKAAVLKQIHDKYVASQDVEDTLKDANETIDEQTRQRLHLQKSVALLQRQQHQQQEITTKYFVNKQVENSALLAELNRLQKENRTLKRRLDNTRSDVEMLETNLKRVRQANLEQKARQTRTVRSVMAPAPTHLTGEWVRQKARAPGQESAFSYSDARGKYVHGSKT